VGFYMYVSAKTFVSINGIAFLLLLAPASGAWASHPLNQYLISDEEIADRCKSSLDAKLDMVAYEDPVTGHVSSVPHCVSTYRSMRDVASGYIGQESSSREIVKGAKADCDANNTQDKCLKAGLEIALSAASAHDGLARAAEAGERKLSHLGNLPDIESEGGEFAKMPPAKEPENESSHVKPLPAATSAVPVGGSTSQVKPIKSASHILVEAQGKPKAANSESKTTQSGATNLLGAL